jgi:hypothetical protein
MKKTLLSLISALIVLTLTACSSKEDVYKPNTIEGQCTIQSEVAPMWVCGGYDDPLKYTAVGSAPYSKLGQNFTRSEAMLNARTNLVNQIKLDIKTKAESYMRSTGLNANEMVERVVTQVSKQTTNMTINDSKQISYWQSAKDKTIYLLVAISKDSIYKTIDMSVKDIVDSEIQIRNSEDALNNMN